MRLILTLLFGIGLIVLSGNTPARGDTQVPGVKLEDLTPKDSPLKFKVQKIKWQYRHIFFWGVVTNSGSKPLDSVVVSVTALDEKGELLARSRHYAVPSDLNGAATGDIDSALLDTDGHFPALIQYKVSGTLKAD